MVTHENLYETQKRMVTTDVLGSKKSESKKGGKRRVGFDKDVVKNRKKKTRGGKEEGALMQGKTAEKRKLWELLRVGRYVKS